MMPSSRLTQFGFKKVRRGTLNFAQQSAMTMMK